MIYDIQYTKFLNLHYNVHQLLQIAVGTARHKRDTRIRDLFAFPAIAGQGILMLIHNVVFLKIHQLKFYIFQTKQSKIYQINTCTIYEINDADTNIMEEINCNNQVLN